MHDTGHHAIGHVLLITVLAGGALVGAQQLGEIAAAGFDTMLKALG